MTAGQVTGAVLLALPVLAVLIAIGRMEGGRAVAFIVAFTSVVMAVVLTGAYLLSGGA